MIVLDTNVVSELMREAPDGNVIDWVDQYSTDQVFLTAVTVAELQYGVLRLPDGRRKRKLKAKIAEMITEDFHDQILPFDSAAAEHYAQLVVRRELGGRPISMADAQIAAICGLRDALLVTRNTKDFMETGVETVNPWCDSVEPGEAVSSGDM